MVLFVFVLLFAAWVAINVQARSYLLGAARRSDIDLAIIERAKSVAGDLAWKKRCGIELGDQQEFTESLKSRQVHFRDVNTYLECSYTDQDEKFRILVFYDATGIVKVEYDTD